MNSLLKLLKERTIAHLAVDKELKEKTYLLQEIAENTDTVYYIYNKDFQLIYVNAYYEKLWGRKKEVLYKKSEDWIEAIHPDDKKHILSIWSGWKKSLKKRFHAEYRIVREKSVYWVTDDTFPVFGKDGKLSLIVGVVRDITEKKKAEIELILKNTLLETMAETSLNGMLVVDNNENVRYFNKRFLTLFHIPELKLKQSTHLDRVKQIVSLIKDKKYYIELLEAIKKNSEMESNDEIELTNGVVLHVYSVPFHYPEQKALWRIWYYQDITAMKRAENKIREHIKKLRTIDKVKTEFLTAVSHELKTPLTAMLLHLQILQEQEDHQLNEQQKKSIQALQRNTSSLKVLIDNILEISRLESETFKLNIAANHDVADCLYKTIDDMHIFSDKKGIRLITKIMPLPRADIDCERIREILANLVGNAIKFTDDGTVTVEAEQQQKNIFVQVTDTGVGIAPDEIPKLTEKFYQVPRISGKNAGTGLGLAIAKKLIELHHGKLFIESTIGKGSTFSFTIPIKQPKKRG